MAEEIKLMKGNEAIAHAAIRYGCDGYFGYPITPQSEVLETLEELMPWETTGMVVLQAESEVAAINMVYGGAATGKAVMTSSSSPGVSLKQEGISYIAAAELPALIVNVMRGGPGLGTIQPSQADRTPAMILADGIVGQMMEKVVLPEPRQRRTAKEIAEQCPWAATGRHGRKERNVVTSLELEPDKMEVNNLRLQDTYRRISENEVRYKEYHTEDAEYLIVAFGSVARICLKAIEDARAQGIKIGLLRPITVWPFPSDRLKELSSKIKGILTVELNAGQMIEDVKLSVECKIPVYHFGRMGGIVPNPGEVMNAFNNCFGEAANTSDL